MSINNGSIVVRSECLSIPANSSVTRLAEIQMVAPEQQTDSTRPSMNLALVIDRSGSMTGEKIVSAQKAISFVLHILSEQDSVAIYSFDNRIDCLTPLAPVSNENRRKFKKAVNSLTARGSTDLFSGWVAGAEELKDPSTPSTLNRVLILTDGEANVGIVAIPEITAKCAEYFEFGVSTSTFGVGEGFNEDLLAKMATSGGGYFHYIAEAADIPKVFQAEMKEMNLTTVKDAMLTVTYPAGGSAGYVGPLTVQQDAYKMSFPFGEMGSLQEQELYLSLNLPETPIGLDVKFRFTFSFKQLDGTECNLESTLNFTAVDEGAMADAPVDVELINRLTAIKSANVQIMALNLYREGDPQEALATLEEFVRVNAEWITPDVMHDLVTVREAIHEDASPSTRKELYALKYMHVRGRRNQDSDLDE